MARSIEKALPLSILIIMVSNSAIAATGNYQLNQNNQCEPGREFIKNGSIYQCNQNGTGSYLLEECEAYEEADRNSAGEPECMDTRNDSAESNSSNFMLLVLILSLLGIGYLIGRKKGD